MNKDQDSFSFDEKQAKKIMRKAKYWSTIKIIGITVLVTPIVLLVLSFGFSRLSSHNAYKAMDEIRLFNEINSPNVHISNQTFDSNWFSGKVQMKTYKILGDRPYIWEPIEGYYNLFGNLSKSSGIYGPIQLEGSESLKETNQFELYNAYTGDREMFFYHPKILYDVYQDSISELEQFEDTTLVELGLSFDQSYSFDEIKSKINPNVKVVWWWVDTYTDDSLDFMEESQNTILADDPFIYGFHAEQSKPKAQQSENESFDEIESNFIRNINLLRESKNFKWEIDQVDQALMGENRTIEKGDVKIIGAVVTGTSDQLEPLQNQPYIKASTFGVISDRK